MKDPRLHKFLNQDELINLITGILPSQKLPVEIISRRDFINTSTFPVEIVKIKTADGKNTELFCKYLAGMGPNNFGHRGGVEYESMVYEHILSKIPVSTIKYFGRRQLPDHNETIMIIEFIGDYFRMNQTGVQDAMFKAAKWLGEFHRITSGIQPEFINHYNHEYYKIWPKNFKRFSETFLEDHPWILNVINFYEKYCGLLSDGPQTIIHGEFYPCNILLKDETIYPVDWESAAKAPGEIDLASLIEGYEDSYANEVIDLYKSTRWINGQSVDDKFDLRLLLARIYFNFWDFDSSSATNEYPTSDSYYNLQSFWKKAQQMNL